MLRIRVAGTLVLAVALLAAACGDEAPEVSTSAEPAVQEEASDPDDSSANAEPSSGQSVAPDRQDAADAPGDGDEDSAAASSDGPDAADAPGDGDEDSAAASSDGPDGAVSTGPGEDSSPADVEALLASATTELAGRSVRGEATIEFEPGFGLSAHFESDADGDVAVTVELPPGLDPEFPGGGEDELRYVGGVVYVRPAVSAETLADLGVDEAWFVAESAAGGDPMSDAMGSAGGVMCMFSQVIVEPFADCDPLGETGTFLEAASEAEIVGREDVRGVEATRVRFLVSLLDLAGEALGMELDEDDAGTSEGVFDDSASDPFAEGLEQIFGFLDADFEVEVWIDDENLIRRQTFDLASLVAGLAGPDAEIPSSLITLEFYDFDADISVEAPPPEAIVDDPDLLRGDDDYASSEEYEPAYDDDDDADDPPQATQVPRAGGSAVQSVENASGPMSRKRA